MERAEKWLPFEVGRCFFMAGRGAGKVVEMNFALDAVRVDFEKSVGVSIPIGVAAKSLTPLPEGHFLHEKLTSRERSARSSWPTRPRGSAGSSTPSGGRCPSRRSRRRSRASFPRSAGPRGGPLRARTPHVVLHGSGKSATVEWTNTTQAADAAILAKFEKAHSPEARLDFFRKNARRDPVLATRMALKLARGRPGAPRDERSLAYELAVAVEKVEGVTLGFVAGGAGPRVPARRCSAASRTASPASVSSKGSSPRGRRTARGSSRSGSSARRTRGRSTSSTGGSPRSTRRRARRRSTSS